MRDGDSQSSLCVVMPNFNHGSYIVEAVEALLCQTRKPDKIIIIDDGSTDDSASLIRAMAAENECIQPVFHADNRGAIVRINQVFPSLDYDYLFFAACDDVSDPDLLRQVSAMLDRFPEAGLCSARTRRINEQGLPEMPPISFDPVSSPEYIPPAKAIDILIRRDGWFWGNTALYRRSALAEIGGFPSDLEGFNDGYVCRAIVLKFGACYVPKTLSSWRRMADGMASQLSSDADKGMKILEQASEMMRNVHGEVFPAAYRRRWMGRYRVMLTGGQFINASTEVRRGLEKVWSPLDSLDRLFLSCAEILSFNRGVYRLLCLGYASMRFAPLDVPRTVASRLARAFSLEQISTYKNLTGKD